MGIIRDVIYGIGGYDESKPNNNIVEIVEISDQGEENESQS